jgi:outer membrane receptor protein involved in Fe transport
MKRIRVFPFICLLFVSYTVTAQDIPDSLKIWKTGGFASFTFNQVSLTNWTAGGENALSATAILNLFANYKKDNVSWDNSLDMGYGFLKNEGKSMRKNEDKMELNSKYGYKAFDHVYYSAQLNYRTQFSEGYNYPNDSVVVSKFNAPGYVTASLGLDYKPNDWLSVFLSPAAGKITIVMDQALADAGAYGVDSGKHYRPEFGASFTAKFQKDIITNVNVMSKLNLFDNYTDKDISNRQNIDVNWELMINIKAGKYLTTSILTNLIYDHNTLAKTQFKESIGVGLSYKF